LLSVKQVKEKFEVLSRDAVTSNQQKQLKHLPLHRCNAHTLTSAARLAKYHFRLIFGSVLQKPVVPSVLLSEGLLSC